MPNNQKIKIFHEVPLSLSKVLGYSISDGDYCLPHLLDINKEYKEYFYQAKKDGRYIIMDNSLHELGRAYDHDRLIYWVNELKPDEFIVPDTWEDVKHTINQATYWSKIELPQETTKVVVTQGKNLNDIFYIISSFRDMGYKKFAFSYGASYYNDLFPHPNKAMGKALGRILAVNTLFNAGRLKITDRIHLLGCAVPQEFSWYEGLPIESIDTSNPVMAAFDGEPYKDFGLHHKPKHKIDEVIDFNEDQIQGKLGLLKENINKFRTINNFHM